MDKHRTHIVMFSALLLFFCVQGLGFEERSTSLRDTSVTLSWTQGLTVDTSLAGYQRDYFLQYYIPQNDGFIESIEFNFADLPMFEGVILAIQIVVPEYTSWPEIQTGEIADSCIAGHLGYYDESTGFEAFGSNWVWGGINDVDGALEDYSYDPLGGQIWPDSGFASLAIDPNDEDQGPYTLFMVAGDEPPITANEPFAVLVKLSGYEGVTDVQEETQIAFSAVQLQMEPQPGLKFYTTESSPTGRCGQDDWGWHIRSFVWDWNVNVHYYGELGINPPGLPSTPKIVSAYPNPFNPSTTIEYEIPEQLEVSLIVYDVSGREVQTLVSASQEAGRHSIAWDGTNQHGHQAAGGMYFVRFQAGEFKRVIKVVYLR